MTGSELYVSVAMQEIEKAWLMVDQAHTKENEAKETIQRLKQEINNLTKMVEHTAGLSMGEEHKSVDQLFHLTPLCLRPSSVSYTHLTLPTTREV